MRRLLSICMVSICLLTAVLAHAQDQQPRNDGWEVIRACVADVPSSKIPREQWDFEGVIFSETGDGVRAIRTDVPTSYFVAFDDGTSFASAGAFSPNGQWFAYPVGRMNWYVNSAGDHFYVADSILVVSTDPQQVVYQVPWQEHGFGQTGSFALPRVEWIDNEQLVAYREMGDDGIVNPFTAEFTPWERETWLSRLSHFSPDFTRAIVHQWREKVSGLYDVENDVMLASFESTSRFLAWMPDASGFVMEGQNASEGGSSTDRQLDIFDRDGQYVETIFSYAGYAGCAVFSPDGHSLAFTAEEQLFVADLLEKRISDYCLNESGIQFWFTNVPRWSPDGNMLTFGYDGYPVLLDIHTLEMDILQYRTGNILGWYPRQ